MSAQDYWRRNSTLEERRAQLASWPSRSPEARRIRRKRLYEADPAVLERRRLVEVTALDLWRHKGEHGSVVWGAQCPQCSWSRDGFLFRAVVAQLLVDHRAECHGLDVGGSCRE